MTMMILKPTEIVTEIVPISHIKGCTVDLVTTRNGITPLFKVKYSVKESFGKMGIGKEDRNG